jgi:hypothetical protein
MKNFSLLLCFGVLVSAFSPAQARPLVPAEERDTEYTGLLPFCDNARVLGEIESDFRGREQSYWSSGLSIVSFQKAQEIGYRPTGVDYVPRRYCRALVFMSDHKVRDISYSIGEREGLIGFTWGTEWCISGLDRNYAFGIDCRAARP